ncbi:hypothetical protein EP073_02900 [Geovibrio thiophilus]|uniref:Basal-body rod modification protein FlgD n=1 Tax=Geovibrio thiophilus TaxID=139438 RepID=A0A410JW56_9BACT|nr:flagellar hook capping FlgD N-terminal domain-containing protein [Geovibrio thiophilus]QAR32383.1 hypothetical protein EP073_02900 [Geovibrio thiophilus]
MTTISDSVQNILNGGSSTTTTTKETGTTEMDMMDFLNLFISQLKNQDPLEPMDNNQLTSQTSQFSMVEQLVSINEAVEKLVDGGSTSNDIDSLFSASSFIGKMVEYEGNSFVFDGESAVMDFDLDTASYSTEIYVYDTDGNLINAVNAGQLDSGRNSIAWDGTDSEGEAVEAGQYKYVVKAYDSTGAEVSVTTYGNGYVSGVSQEDGKIVFDLFGEELDADKVIAVRSY